jgi:hypothetical protein
MGTVHALPRPPLTLERSAMQRSAEITLLLVLLLVAVAYRVAFLAARRLAVAEHRAHALAIYPKDPSAGRPAGGAL